MRRRTTKAVPSIDTTHHVRDTERAGEIVRIAATRGKFRFVAHVLNTKTEGEWIELWGPLSTMGRGEAFRAVRPERLKATR